jgi:hypothetical protein
MQTLNKAGFDEDYENKFQDVLVSHSNEHTKPFSAGERQAIGAG